MPGPDMPHLFKLFDIHMMCWGTDRERTEAPNGRLLDFEGVSALSTVGSYPSAG